MIQFGMEIICQTSQSIPVPRQSWPHLTHVLWVPSDKILRFPRI
jgi:hypothetical protein